MSKARFSKDFFEIFAFYGLDMEPEPEPYLVKHRNRNRKFSKVRTGTETIKNSYGSTTLDFCTMQLPH
jgi:hypothetical protein